MQIFKYFKYFKYFWNTLQKYFKKRTLFWKNIRVNRTVQSLAFAWQGNIVSFVFQSSFGLFLQGKCSRQKQPDLPPRLSGEQAPDWGWGFEGWSKFSSWQAVTHDIESSLYSRHIQALVPIKRNCIKNLTGGHPKLQLIPKPGKQRSSVAWAAAAS